MEQYRKILKNRLIILSVGLVASLAMLALSIVMTIKGAEDGSHYEGFLVGTQFGGSFGAFLILISWIVKYARTVKNETKLKKLYICENDERNKLIMEKSGGYILLFCGAVIVIAAIPFGYIFTSDVFYTMYGCGVFLVLTKLILKAYYSVKF